MNQNQQITLLGGLIIVAAGVFYFDQRGPGGISGVRASQNAPAPFVIENPTLRRDKLRASQATEYKSSGRDIFSEVVTVEDETAPKPQRPPQGPQQPPPPPPPPPLTLPVKFYGYDSVPTKRAFLTDGDKIYIVAEGDTLLGRLRILRINNASLEFEEISTHERGTAPLEQQGAPQ
jgi:hypothetical protein